MMLQTSNELLDDRAEGKIDSFFFFFQNHIQSTIISQFLASDSFREAISKHIFISCNEHSQGFTS